MTPYEYRRIPLNLIDVPEDRFRGRKPERIETLAKDIGVQGQLYPVLVVEEESGRYTLAKGLQRIGAIELLQRGEIDARVTPAKWIRHQERRLQEIMATLNREDFTKLERAEALAELKRVYEELHPETKNGAQGGRGGKKKENEIFAFSIEAAEKTGLSRRSIELAVQIVSNLTEATKGRIRDTWLATKQADLKALSEQTAGQQQKILDLLFADPPAAASVAEANTLAEGRRLDSPTEKAYRAVLDKWGRFEIRQKRSFVQTNAAELIKLLKAEGAL